MDRDFIIARFEMIEETTKEILGNIRSGDYLSATFLLGGLNIICQTCNADLEALKEAEIDVDWYKAESK